MVDCASTLLPLPSSGATTHVLHPGDVVRAEQGDRLETLLGSCIAVILTDPRRTTAVMSHIVHIGRPPTRGHADTRYGVVAFQCMYAMLRAVGIEPRLCQAFVAGGGNMFPAQYEEGPHVGAHNVRWVLDTLESEGIRVLLCDVGGTTYRRMTWTVGVEAPEVKAVDIRGMKP